MPQPTRPPERNGKAPTIYTVAAHAGVSHQTVSRYLKGESLRAGNRERVEQAMKELDFHVNDTARALATNRARRIGAFIFEVDDWAPQRVLSGAAEAARRAGYVLDIVRVDANDDASIDQAVNLMNRTSLAGVVVLSPSDPMLGRLRLERLRAPWFVEAEPALEEGHDDTAHHPFAQVVDHLADLGHERFFHVGGPLTWLPARNRRAAYREVIRRRGLVNCGETTGEWGAPWGAQAMRAFPIGDKPTAIVAASDQLALGALHWLHERGIRVPEDVSVTGYDGIPDAAYFWPPLTTVEVDFAHLGRRTVDALIAHEASGRRPDDSAGPTSTLVVRASSAPPPAAR